MTRFKPLFVSVLVLSLLMINAKGSSQGSSLFTDITGQALGDAPFIHFGAFADAFPLTPGLPGRPAQLVWLGGVTIADFNGDGWNDIFATNGFNGPNALYLNKGDGVPTFREVAQMAGIDFPNDEAAAAVAGDIDNDGDIDLYIANVGLTTSGGVPINQVPGPNRLLINEENDENGVPHFHDVALEANATGDLFTRSQLPSFVDFDADGDLDIFVAAHTSIVTSAFPSDSPMYPFKREPNRVDLLLRNNLRETGRLSFTDVTDLLRNELNGTVGADGRPILDSRFTFDGVWIDYDNDGRPDLFQANELGSIGLFRNEGAGRFRYLSPQAGLTDIGAWMSLTPGDINNDGWIDFFATNVGVATSVPTFTNRQHALYLNNGNGTFTGVAGRVGNPSSDGDASGDFGWGAQMFDFDNDGDLDLFFIGNWWPSGFGVRDGRDFLGRPFTFQGGGHTNRGHLFENRNTNPDGTPILVDLMESASGRAAVGIDNPKDGRSVAVGDLNNDGFLDIVVANVSGRATAGSEGAFENLGLYRGGLVIYKNNGNTNRSLKIQLRGTSSNRDGIGARVTVVTDQGSQIREARAGEGHLSSNAPEVHFGLGESVNVERIEVRWPSGTIQPLQNPRLPSPGETLVITEPEGGGYPIY